jgi:hypothetical protein
MNTDKSGSSRLAIKEDLNHGTLGAAEPQPKKKEPRMNTNAHE